jgi:excisionase family DNA binding protein
VTITSDATASPLLTTREPARYLRLSRSAFYASVLPRIPQVRPTPGRVLLRKEDLDEFIESQMRRAT